MASRQRKGNASKADTGSRAPARALKSGNREIAVGEFSKKYRAGEASAQELPGPATVTIPQGESSELVNAPVTERTKKRTADNLIGANKPAAKKTVIPRTRSKVVVDTSNPPSPPVQGTRTEASNQAVKKGVEEVLYQRATRAVRKQKAAEAAESIDITSTDPDFNPRGTKTAVRKNAQATGSAVVSSSKPARRASKAELARKAAAAERREAKPAAPSGAVVKISAVTAKAASELAKSRLKKGVTTAPWNRPVSTTEATLGLLGVENVDAVQMPKQTRTAPAGTVAQTEVDPEEMKALETKISKAKTTESRSRHERSKKAKLNRVTKDKQTLVDMGLTPDPGIEKERTVLESKTVPGGIFAGMSPGRAEQFEGALAKVETKNVLLQGSMRSGVGTPPPTTRKEMNLRVATRKGSEIPRVKPNPANTELEVRAPGTTDVATRYAQQRNRRIKIKKIQAENALVEDPEKMQKVPEPLSGRTDNKGAAPKPVEVDIEGYRSDVQSVPKPGGKKTTFIPVASGSDVVTSQWPTQTPRAGIRTGQPRRRPAEAMPLKSMNQLVAETGMPTGKQVQQLVEMGKMVGGGKATSPSGGIKKMQRKPVYEPTVGPPTPKGFRRAPSSEAATITHAEIKADYAESSRLRAANMASRTLHGSETAAAVAKSGGVSAAGNFVGNESNARIGNMVMRNAAQAANEPAYGRSMETMAGVGMKKIGRNVAASLPTPTEQKPLAPNSRNSRFATGGQYARGG